MTDFDLLKRIDNIRVNIGLAPLNLSVEEEGEDPLNRYLHEVDTSVNCVTFNSQEIEVVKIDLMQAQRLLQERDETIETLHNKLKEQRVGFEDQLRQVCEKYQGALNNTKEKYEHLVEFYEEKLKSEDQKKTPDKSEGFRETIEMIHEIERLKREQQTSQDEEGKTISDLKKQLKNSADDFELIKQELEKQLASEKEKKTTWKTTALKLKEGMLKNSRDNVRRT